MEGFPQKLGVSRSLLTENSYFLYRVGAPSYGRVGRKFQRIRGGAVGREPAASMYIDTNMTFSH